MRTPDDPRQREHKLPTKVTVSWSRGGRDPGQTWRFWIDRGAGFTGYRLAWFYVTVSR